MKYKITKLKDIAEISMGQSPSSKYYNKTKKGIPFLQGVSTFGEMFPQINTYTTVYRKEAKSGDILFSVRAPVGKVNFANQKTAIGRGLATIRVKKTYSKFYIYYFLKKNGRLLDFLSSGTVFTSINKKDLEEIRLKIPNRLNDQQQIAEKLLKIDKKIDINNQINDNLLELAKALFHEKFSYDDEVLLSNYFLPKKGKNLLKRNVVNGYIPVVAGGLTPAAFHNKSNTESPVITISSSGANAGYTQIWGQKVWSSDSSYIDKTVTNNIYFWYLLIKSHQKQIFDSQTGSAQPHVYPRDIGNILIPKINEVVAKKVDKAVTPVFQKIFQNKDENKKLDNIKAVLLDRYFD